MSRRIEKRKWGTYIFIFSIHDCLRSHIIRCFSCVLCLLLHPNKWQDLMQLRIETGWHFYVLRTIVCSSMNGWNYLFSVAGVATINIVACTCRCSIYGEMEYEWDDWYESYAHLCGSACLACIQRISEWNYCFKFKEPLKLMCELREMYIKAQTKESENKSSRDAHWWCWCMLRYLWSPLHTIEYRKFIPDSIFHSV